MGVVTRFAPSPTGALHIGGVRTALFTWLHARQHKGRFLLRIEDTDSLRSTQASTQNILSAMRWLGLDWDTPLLYQSTRNAAYQTAISQLLDAGKAYRCYCDKARLVALRQAQMARQEKPRYDGRCRPQTGTTAPSKAPESGTSVVRLMTPHSGQVCFHDTVHGQVRVENSELDDLIIARSDGQPTYHFAAVFDDIQTGVNHVIRGDDHLSNTPRQWHVIQALGGTVPKYTHVPMILDEQGQRLSKRHGAAGVLGYRDQGILPVALCNYLARLGWSYGNEEVFSLSRLLQVFDLTQVHASPAAFNAEKLLWINQQHLQSASVQDVLPLMQWHCHQQGIDLKAGPDLAAIVSLQRSRYKTVREMAAQSHYFYSESVVCRQAVKARYLGQAAQVGLHAAYVALCALPESQWEAAALQGILKQVCRTLDLKFPQLAQPLRAAVTGDVCSPSIDKTLQFIGRRRSMQRLKSVLGL